MGYDFQFAVRQFFSQRLYAAVAVITLALGIGSTTAIFSIVDAVLPGLIRWSCCASNGCGAPGDYTNGGRRKEESCART
jgi:hypothetical protein